MKLILCLLLLNPLLAYSQRPKTYYVDMKGDRVFRSDAFYARSVTKADDKWNITDSYLNGGVQMKATCLDRKLKIKTDSATYYYINGKKASAGMYTNGNRHGKWHFYSIVGKIKSVGEYNKGKYTGTWVWYDDKGNLSSTLQNASDSKMKRLYSRATFPGGEKALIKFVGGMVKPEKSFQEGYYGITYTSFRIDINGNLRDIEVFVHGTPEMDSMVVKRIKQMPEWIPASKNGVAKESWYTLPVKFSLYKGQRDISDKLLASAFYNSGIEDYKSNNFKRAVHKFKEAIKKNYQDPRYYYNLALCYWKLEKYEFCCAYFDIVNRLDRELVSDKIKSFCQ